MRDDRRTRSSHDDAAYVLGALDAAERAAFEAHLPTCADCRARVDELRPTAGLLLDGSGRRAITGPRRARCRTPLLPGLLRRAARERPAPPRLVGAPRPALAAACLVALVVVAVARLGALRPRRPAVTAVAPSPVRATAVLVGRPWGTQIDLRCQLRQRRSRPGRHLRAAWSSTAPGAAHDAGHWTLAPGGVDRLHRRHRRCARERDRARGARSRCPTARRSWQLTALAEPSVPRISSTNGREHAG